MWTSIRPLFLTWQLMIDYGLMLIVFPAITSMCC